MSDLRTEIFTKVLPKMQSLTKPTELSNLNFDDPDQPMAATPETPEILTNNELIFNFVKNHPACYGATVAKAFEGRINNQSVLSQVHTMSRRGLFHKVKCSTTGWLMYSVAVDAYPRAQPTESTARLLAAMAKMTPEERSKRIREGHRKSKLKQAEQKLAEKKKIVLVKKTTGEQVSPPPAVTVPPVDLNTLSIVQARKLYDELKQIFGA